MIDTIVFRLHGINSINTGNLDVMAQQNGGITPYTVPEHQSLYNAMLIYKGKYFKMNRIYKKIETELSELEGEDYLDNKFFREQGLTFDWMEFRDGDEEKKIMLPTRGKLDVVNNNSDLIVGSQGSLRTTSSINYVQFKLNPNAGFIEFEFSIPKYLYGHNLAEFVPQGFADIIFGKGKNYDFNKFSSQNKFLYDRLIKFIEKFLHDLCLRFKLETLMNLNYVEIRRIDICWNQYYKSKEDALRALREKKKLNSKKHRKNQKNINSNGYAESLIYRSASGSYFKIYHKGTEYVQADGDFAKHSKINREYLEAKFRKFRPINDEQVKFKDLYYVNKKLLGLVFHDTVKYGKYVPPPRKEEAVKLLYSKLSKNLPWDCYFLKKEMDKVLRHELSVSSPFFKYVYKRKIFRKNDVYHIEAMHIYKKVKSAYDKRNNKEEVEILKYEHDIHKHIHSWLNRSICLTLTKNKNVLKYVNQSLIKGTIYSDYNVQTNQYRIRGKIYNKTSMQYMDIGIFNKEMLTICVQHFRSLVNDFMVDNIEPDINLSSRIEKYNTRAKIKLEAYNKINSHLIYDFRGKNIIKGNRIITKASQLLTEKQKEDRHLKQINTAPLIGIINYMEKGKSMQSFFDLHKITSSSRSRYKKHLSLFKIFDKTIITDEPIVEETDFSKMYENTENFIYRKSFYYKRDYYNYD